MYDIDIDGCALDLIPDDLPEIDLLPCKVHADGNCLPYLGIFAYNNADQVEEMRVRIIMEQVKNEKYYLNDDFLQTGQYAQYSESFVQGNGLTNTKIQSTYRKQVLSIT